MKAVFLKSAFRPADIPKSKKPQIAMLGRSNVGKSSLINHMAGAKELARSSSTPGLTRAINLYEFDGRYLLADLPGYGFSEAARSRGKGFDQMIGDYLSQTSQLRLVLLIIDSRRGLAQADRDVLDQLLAEKIPVTIILNKTDKISNMAAIEGRRKILKEFPDLTCILHSTADSAGLSELNGIIERLVRAERSA